MNIKLRLTVMSFLQFFVWGAWLITIGNFWFGTKQWSGTDFGIIFSRNSKYLKIFFLKLPLGSIWPFLNVDELHLSKILELFF